MALFLTVSQGDRASRARPILAISDQEIVAAMMRPLGRLIDHADRASEGVVEERARQRLALLLACEEAGNNAR